MMDDPRFAPIRRYENVSGVWGWVAAVSALLLIGFIIVASFNNSSNTASNDFTMASRTATPPSTEGSGSSSPIAPAPSKGGTQ